MRLVCGQVVWGCLICRPDPQVWVQRGDLLLAPGFALFQCTWCVWLKHTTSPVRNNAANITSWSNGIGRQLSTHQTGWNNSSWFLLKYFNFPRNPEKIIPWGSVMNEGIAFQSPDQDPTTRAPVTTHLAWWREGCGCAGSCIWDSVRWGSGDHPEMTYSLLHWIGFIHNSAFFFFVLKRIQDFSFKCSRFKK